MVVPRDPLGTQNRHVLPIWIQGQLASGDTYHSTDDEC